MAFLVSLSVCSSNSEACKIDDQAPSKKGLKISVGLSGVHGIGSHFRFPKLTVCELYSLAFENGLG